MSREWDVLVVGGGPIGLAAAWRLGQRGLRTLVLEAAQPGAGAARAAAGMLAVAGEVEYGETEALVALSRRSAESYPAFVEELREVSGRDPGYRSCGTLHVALSGDDVAVLRRRHAYLQRLDLRASWLDADDCRALEPALSPRTRGGIHSHDDHQVDPRRLCDALAEAVRRTGGSVRGGAAVSGLVVSGERVTGVAVDGDRIAGGTVLVAAGAWTSALDGVPGEVRAALRPVKGQTLRLRGAPLVDRVLWAPDAYVVPRADGEVVVGATVEERGFDRTVTAGAVLELLRGAYETVPGITELELVETCASVRPGTRDNEPVVGAGDRDGLVLATGHYRNGILLTPVTAEAVADLVETGLAPEHVRAFSPDRFTRDADHAQR